MEIAIHCAHDATIALTELKPHPQNPNTHPEPQIALLAKIIREQGWRNPIVVSNRSGYITKGHGRLAAAKLAGVTVAPVDYQDYANEKQELADMIADNRIAELAELDRSLMRELAEQLDDGAFDMDLTGFDHDALEELMTAAPPDSDIDAEPQIDKAEELRVKWGVERGQIWELGEHRIMCGDSTDETALSKLMDKDAALIVTSPPYDNEESYEKGKTRDQWKKLIENVTAAWSKFLITGGVFALNMGNRIGRNNIGFCNNALESAALSFMRRVVWKKPDGSTAPVHIHTRNHPDALNWHPAMVTEDITFFVNGERRKPITDQRLDKELFFIHFTDCWQFPGISSDVKAGHPATFPVLLPKLVMSFNTALSEIVGEPFSGAGTTIIACEQLGRKCRAMEIDPGYVAVSIQRWADATGKTPKLLK